MDESFNIASYIKAVERFMSGKQKQGDAGRLLLDSIVNQMAGRVEKMPDVDDKMVSNLCHRNREVPGDIKTFAKEPDVQAGVLGYFTEEFPQNMGKKQTDDLCKELVRLLNDDESVSDRSRAALTAPYEAGNIAKFLADSFLYAINIRNQPSMTQEELALAAAKALPLDDEIKKVIDALKANNIDIDESPINDPLMIDHKILPENGLLISDTTDRVLRYYNYIKELFSSLDREKSGRFESTRSQINSIYKTTDKIDFKLPQEAVIELVSENILRKAKLTRDYKRACDVVVAFFIQNCEVFNEIPEQSNAV